MKRVLVYILTLLTLITGVTCGSGQASAHDAVLNIEYDICTANEEADGIDELWYSISYPNFCRHISQETTEIRYYFESYWKDHPQYTWTSTGLDASAAAEIKTAIANSMEKWNNVYFYSYDDSGNVVKNKVINVIPAASPQDSNLLIYPRDFGPIFDSGDDELMRDTNGTEDHEKTVAITGAIGMDVTDTTQNMNHHHNSKWSIGIDIEHFYVHGQYTSDYVNLNKERVGAHELGHVLGLLDVDTMCPGDDEHHHEILMGYGQPPESQAQDITYKDIAGVAITRGFHTDNDHKWLYKEMKDGKYKMICSICNGVKWIDSFNGYTYGEDYFLYGLCTNNHDLIDGNMMAVASYQNKDYYKCKYCRYVAPFEDIVEQNYSVTSLDNLYHQWQNNVSGLDYTFTELHKANICVYINGNLHRETCSCGRTVLASHSVLFDDIENGRYANCLGCGRRLDLTKDDANIIHGITNMRTANGSYILPNGIVVLVQADLEAYENGTLQFYNVGDQTQTE